VNNGIDDANKKPGDEELFAENLSKPLQVESRS